MFLTPRGAQKIDEGQRTFWYIADALPRVH